MANFAEGKSTSMAPKFGEDRKYRSTRRKGDDSRPTKVIGVIKMLKNVRIRLYVATTIAALPFLVSFALYVSLFSFFGQFVIGFLCGLCVEFAYLLLNLHRNHVRRRLVCDFALLIFSLDGINASRFVLFCLVLFSLSLIQFRHPPLKSDTTSLSVCI